MAQRLQSYREAIERFPSAASLASALGLPRSTVSSWSTRDSIPPVHFARIGAIARRRKIPLTERQLHQLFRARAQAYRAPPT